MKNLLQWNTLTAIAGYDDHTDVEVMKSQLQPVFLY